MAKKLLNRDISWIRGFNERVLDESKRSSNHLGERIMFAGIAASNFTEFLSVRYPAALEETPDDIPSIDAAIGKHYIKQMENLRKLNKEHRFIRRIKDLGKDESKWAEKYFRQNVFPGISPITVTKARKPSIHAGLYIMFLAEDKDDESQIGYIEVPASMDRFIPVPKHRYVILLEDLIMDNIKSIINGRKITQMSPFSITRSSEVYVQPDGIIDPYELIKKTLKERDRSWITQLEVSTGKKDVVRILRKLLPIQDNTFVFMSDIIRLTDLKDFPTKEVLPEKEWPRSVRITETFPRDENIFDFIRKEDRLCFHPYESYDASVLRFIESAASDPAVQSIRISLYRTAKRSDIEDALLKAADSGKLVTVLIELKARFDEKHNIEVANILREGGVRVIFTKPDMKAHAKVCIVTRKEKKGLRIYAHVGSGNYNLSNSRLYTDYSYFTADPDICEDLVRFFNLLSSDQTPFKSDKIIYSPYNLKDTIVKEIDNQIKRAKDGKKARIIVKCNALTEPQVAKKLQEAAEKGVKVQMIIRSSCILQPQKNLTIRSIVGQNLEHSRLYGFQNGKENDDMTVYIGSSDLMTRSMKGRYELLIKVKPKELRHRLIKHMGWYLTDTKNARMIKDDYGYEDVKPPKGTKEFDCMKTAEKEARKLAV